MKTIILTGGGTAGHTLPNIALLPKLKEYFDQIIYIGSINGIEKDLIANYPFVKYYGITTTKFRRSLSLSNLLIPFKLRKGIKEAYEIIQKYSPSVIFSKGGFVGLPVVLAGKKCGIPLFSHESDLTLGLSNKLTTKYFTNIFTTFSETASKLPNGIHTGTPFGNIFNCDKQTARQLWNLNSNLPVLTILGGSLGSANINSIIRDCIPEISKTHQILHITGKGKIDTSFTHSNYHQIEFTNRMAEVYSITDLCITRGGSNAIHELLAHRIPMLIIPLSRGSRGDQILNAQYFTSHGYALSIDEQNITKSNFLSAFNDLVTKQNLIHSTTLNATPLNAVEKITNILIRTAKKNSKN